MTSKRTFDLTPKRTFDPRKVSPEELSPEAMRRVAALMESQQVPEGLSVGQAVEDGYLTEEEVTRAINGTG